MDKIYIPYFHPIGHLYETADGTPLDSVTTIIKEETGQRFYGDGSAAERGTAVHKACQYYDEKDLAVVPENIIPYLEQYKLALAAHKIVVLENEQMRYHPQFFYAGTLDKIVRIDGALGIIDIKTGQKYTEHKWQLAAYADMIKHEHTEPLRRWALYLTPESFQLEEFTDRKDFTEFLVFFSSHNLKIKYGYRKPKTQGETV